MINEMKNMNVPFTMKSEFLSAYNDNPQDKSKATSISINPVIPESIPNKLPAMNEIRYETTTTTKIITIGFLIRVKNNELEAKLFLES